MIFRIATVLVPDYKIDWNIYPVSFTKEKFDTIVFKTQFACGNDLLVSIMCKQNEA